MLKSKLKMLGRSDRASALVAVIIFGVIISVCAAFAYRSTIFQTRMASRSGEYLAALNVAEAGAERAVLELNKSTDAWSGWGGSDTKTYSETIKDTNDQGVGDVDVQVSNPAANPRITATGYIPNKANAKIMRTVQLTIKSNTVASPWGEFGLFAFGDLTVSGGINVKSFEPTDVNQNTMNATVGAMGNVTLVGSPTIYGNLQAGQDLWFANNSITVTGSAYYGGNFGYKKDNYPNKVAGEIKRSSIREPNRRILPEAPTYPGSNNNSNVTIRPLNGGGQTKNGIPSGTDLSIGNSVVTFPAPGTYYLSSFKNNNNSQLKISGTGDVKIFVTGDFDLSAISTTDILAAVNGQDGPKLTLVAKNAKFTQYGEINIKGNSQFDVFADKLVGNGSKAVSIDNEARLLISVKDLDYGGGANLNVKPWTTNAGNPANLQMFATGSAWFGQGAHVSGILYAPDVDPLFDGGLNWWGAVIGNNITVANGANIGVDETLFKPGGGSGAVVTAWTEVSPKKL